MTAQLTHEGTQARTAAEAAQPAADGSGKRATGSTSLFRT